MDKEVNYEDLGLILTPEQLAVLEADDGAESAGDTDADGEKAPDAEDAADAPDGGESETSESDAGADEDGADGGVPDDDADDDADKAILAKDGKHTIPYEKLVEAREAEKSAKAEAQALRERIAQLEKGAEKPEGKTADDSDNSLFGDFSDEDMKKGVEKLIQEKLAGYEASLKQQEAAKAHYREIYTAHPDADSIVESRELEEWLAGQNPLVRKAFHDALKDGTAAEVIGAFDMFKAAKSAAEPEKPVEKPAEKPPVRKNTPNTLSDIPAGRDHTASDSPLDNLSGNALAEKLASMTEEQVEKFLNS